MRALQPALARFFRERRHALAFSALLLAVPGLFSEPPPEPNLTGLSGLLDQATGAHTAPADIAWEPRRGVVTELTLGRGVVFLAAPQAGAARDLYRAWVRLTPGGQPLAVNRVVRLTDTPLADECGLLVHGTRATFTTVSNERVRAVTLLGGLGGTSTLAASFLARIAALANEGSFTPLERTDIVLDPPVVRAEVTLEADALKLELDASGAPSRYVFAENALSGKVAGLHVLAREPSQDSARTTLLDLARSAFGAPAVRASGRALYAVRAAFARVFPAERGTAGETASKPLRRDWLALPAGLVRELGAPEPYFETRIVRSEAGTRLLLVGIDVRQLELAVQAGTEWPRAWANVPGAGRLPRDSDTLKRVVAVFNAGPESPYERSGAMAGGRVLTPAKSGAPGVLFDAARGLVLERFAFGESVPASVLGFEQRSAFLLEDRPESLDSASRTEPDRSVRRRSALCTTRAGELYYAFADASDEPALARGLRDAGCSVALPLAAAPEQLGFALSDLDRSGGAHFELVDPAMDLEPQAFLHGSSRGFFYVSLRETRPKAPPGATWTPDGGAQPAPVWLPSILKSELTLGALRIELVSVDHSLVNFRLRAGASEVGARGEAWVGVLDSNERERALITLDLGHATAATRYGLVLGASIPLALRPAYATLVLGGADPPRILLPGESVTLAPGAQAVQLPLLADDGDITERARERGDARLRAALGITPEGRLVVASSRHDSSDPLAVALRSAGCKRVLELDRGSHHPAALGRSGTETPPPEDPKTTTLWILRKSTP